MKVGIYNTTDGGGRRFEACRELFEGVRYLSTTSAGFDHYNLEAMKKYGIRGANVPQYSPNAVSEHTVLLTLAALRKLRQQFSRTENRDYRTDGLMARELHSMTAGIIGCGRIGMTTIRCLSGFGLKKLYASDPFEREDVRQFAEYASPETLYRECDIILFHAAATSENYHMINDAAIASMKKGMLLVNCAHGSVCKGTRALTGADRSAGVQSSEAIY